MSTILEIYVGAYIKINTSRLTSYVPKNRKLCKSTTCAGQFPELSINYYDANANFCPTCGERLFSKDIGGDYVVKITDALDELICDGRIIQNYSDNKNYLCLVAAKKGEHHIEFDAKFEVGLIAEDINSGVMKIALIDYFQDYGIDLDKLIGKGNWEINVGVLHYPH